MKIKTMGRRIKIMKNVIAITVLAIVFVLFNIGVFIPSYVSPVFATGDNSSVDNLNFTLPTSCTLASVGEDSHTTTLLNGVYKSDIGSTTIGVFCNDQNGYLVYAVGASDNIEGNNVLVSNINNLSNSNPNSGSGSNNYDIVTGTATSGNTSNWAMKLAYVVNDNSPTPPTLEPSFLSYTLIPSTWTKVASKSSGTTDMSSGSSLTTTYAVYTSPTQPAGTYTGKVKYALFHPYLSHDPITLAKSYYNAGKSKYILKTDNTIIAEDSEGAADIPAEDIIGRYYTMQDMETSICANTEVIGEASQLQVIDTRDHNIYWITKLADNNCWMTENLDLNLSTEIALTSENTDLSTDAFVYTSTGIYVDGYIYNADTGIVTWNPERSTIPEGNLNAETWPDSYTHPYSYDAGDLYPNTDLETNAGTHGLAGNYYNWTAAVASNNSSKIVTGNAANSICPKNWRLPNTTNFEFSKLLYAYGITKDDKNTAGYANGAVSFNKMVDSPLWFVRGGHAGKTYLRGVQLDGVGSEGYYLSSTVYSSSGAGALSFRKSSVNPADETSDNPYNGRYGRRGGDSIRCLAR